MRILTLIVAVVPVLMGQAPDAAWGPPLPPEPFQTQPFRPVVVPDWVHDLTRMSYTLSQFGEEDRSRFAAAGGMMSEVFFIDPLGAAYDNPFIKTRLSNRPPDYIDREIASYRKHGIGVLAVIQPSLQAEAYDRHPEWRRVPFKDGVIPPSDLTQQPLGGPLCMLGPWGQVLIDTMVDIVKRYPDVKAFTFDGIHHYDVCYCESCRAAYKKATGKEIPDRNMDDPEFRRYVHFEDRRMEELIRRMQLAIKSVRPEVGIITWTTNAGRFGHFQTIPRNMPARMNLLFDSVDQEFWMDETNRGSTVISAFANAYMWAVTDHRVAYSTPYLMSHGNPYGTDSLPPLEYLHRSLLALTHGVRPSTIFATTRPLQETAVKILAETRARERWMKRIEPEPWAALVMSDNTNTFYGRRYDKVEERYLSHVLGAFRTGLEEHLPMTVINDWNLTEADLARYKVLVLANTACLSDAQAEAVRGFVRNGGGLIATGEASLYNEFGDPRKNFALSDVFGVDYKGAPASQGSKEQLDVNFTVGLDKTYQEQRKNIFDLSVPPDSLLAGSEKWKEYVPSGSVTYKGRAVIVELSSPGAKAVATMRLREEGARDVPSAVVHGFGKGKVAYLAAALDSAYYLYPYPYERLMLRSAMDTVASSPAPVRIAAPMSVQANIVRQKLEGERLVIHLYNALNSTADHGLPTDDVPLREEVVPVHDIRVALGPMYRVREVYLQPENIRLEPRPLPDGTMEFVVPKLEIHAMVVAELQ